MRLVLDHPISHRFKRIYVLLLVLAIGCDPSTKSIPEKIQTVEVYRGSKDVSPGNRTLSKIGNMDSSGVQALERYIHESNRRPYSYVISSYYLNIVDKTGKYQRRYGVVIDSDGQMSGLDVTTDNPAETHVTSPHFLMVTKDINAGMAILESIRNLEKKPEGTNP
jgi:hypothetical protein